MRQLITFLQYGAGTVFVLSLFVAVLAPGVGEGQELTCLPAPAGPIVETCPSSDGKCVRIKVGEPSFLSSRDKKEIAFVLRDVIDTKIPPLVEALKDLKKEAETCESNCDFSPKRKRGRNGANAHIKLRQGKAEAVFSCTRSFAFTFFTN